MDSKASLEHHFDESDVYEEICSCDGSKAPSPNGFKFSFLKKYWKIMKVDIMKFMEDFHSNAKLAKGMNSSFISLIPKEEFPNDLSKYRPINLVSSMYKVLSKTLARRLRMVIHEVISNNQTAFIKGR